MLLNLSLIYITLASLAFLSASFFHWLIASYLSPGAMAVLAVVLLLAMGLAFILSAITMFMGLTHRQIRAAIAPLITGGAIALAFLVPWTKLYVDTLWQLNHGTYQRAVAFAEGHPAGTLLLPPALHPLLTRGAVAIVGTDEGERLVTILAYQGRHGHYAGYCFTDRDRAPVGFPNVVREAPRWYWVAR